MNDHDAMWAVAALVEQYCRTQITSVEAMNYIAQVVGANRIEHLDAKEQGA